MTPKPSRPGRILVSLAICCLVPPAAAHAGDPDLGRQIYRSGTAGEGPPILALIGPGTEVPASALPCAGCHGEDGRGNAEGGVAPSDLTWPALTKPYGVDHPGGRRHPPYDERLLTRAVTMGLDPAGNELHVAMPRYRLTHEQAAALVAHIQRLGVERDPGIEDDRLTLGVVLPPEGRLGGWSTAIRSTLEAYVDRLNGNGGLFGRRLAVAYVAAPEEPIARREAVARFLDQERVFALVAGFMAGAERPLAELLAQRRVPLVGPFTLDPQVGYPLNPYVFYILPGLAQQARALVDFAALRLRGPDGEAASLTVVHSGRQDLVEIAAVLIDRSRTDGVASAVGALAFETPLADPRGLVAAARLTGSSAVLFLGDEAETAAFLTAAERARWHPALLLLSSLAGGAVQAATEVQAERIFLAFPSSSGDRSARAHIEHRALSERYDLPAGSASLQLSVISAMELLVEGLERAGRDLSRDKLVAALETLHRFETGITPPLTYGPNRRIGAFGAYVVPLSRGRLRPPSAADWVGMQ